MSGKPLQSKVVISSPQGLHLRPIRDFVQLAQRFQSAVFVYKTAAERVDGKSPLGLMGLGAIQGTELTLEVAGPDQEDALRALLGLLDNLSAYEAEEL